MKDVAKFLVGELKPFKKSIIFLSALALFAAALEMLAPLVMGRGFDLAGKKMPFVWYGGAIFAWFALRVMADRTRAHIRVRGYVITESVSTGYATKTLAELLDKKLSFHYGKKIGDVSQRISDLWHQMADGLEGFIFEFIPNVLAIIAILAYLVFLDWRIALILIATISLFLFYTLKTTPQIMANQQEWREISRKLNSLLWDAISNVLVVKSTTNEALVERERAKREKEYHAAGRNFLLFDRRVTDGQNLIAAVAGLAVLLVAVSRFAQGELTFGLLTAITAYVFAIFGHIRFVQWTFRGLLKMAVNYRAVRVLADEPSEDFKQGRAIDLQGNVEFKNVRFRYRDEKPILEDVSFSASRGERVAIVGESGEGKTTLVDLISRYYEPRSGELLLDGIDSREINLKSLRSQMAYVPQDLTLFHESIDFNIRCGRPEATDKEVREAARLAHLDEFIESLPEKYETIVGERGLKLSGGERQRIALARAFLRNPNIIILDEPTAHLDSKTEEYIQESLEELMAGRTTFIIAHRLRTVRDADKILVLKDGKIMESGRHEELLRKPDGLYANLLEKQGGFITPEEQHLGEVAE